MLLKFLGHKHPTPFEVGEVYDVAEIFEMPMHVMVRRPGEERWPVPGSPWFGWHPDELFERTDKPIEIISCGFFYNEYLSEFYGVLVRDAGHIETLRKLKELEYECPDNEDEVAAWEARVAAEFSVDVARALSRLDDSLICCEFGVFDNVFLAEEAGIGPSVGFAGCDLVAMGRMEISKALVRRTIEEFLEPLGIRGLEPRDHACGFWQGPGGRRLISPPEGMGCPYVA